jgi:hypothetical protein
MSNETTTKGERIMDTETKEFDLTHAIISYESGEMEEAEFLELFSYLIKTRLAWTLQGCYGRTAAALISNRIISPDGEVL